MEGARGAEIGRIGSEPSSSPLPCFAECTTSTVKPPEEASMVSYLVPSRPDSGTHDRDPERSTAELTGDAKHCGHKEGESAH
jgi:hypothetical protein